MTIIDDLKPLEENSIARKIPIIGSDKGIWLLHKIKELKPKNILELGTANGYSGCILGCEDALLTTVELDENIAKEARENFKKYNIAANIIIDDGVAAVKELVLDEANKGSFDLIFIDFAKKKYDEVLEDCIKLVRINGLIIADNISAEGCQDFRHRIFTLPQLKTELVNIKDGMSCSERLK